MIKEIVKLERLSKEYGNRIQELSNLNTTEAASEFRLLTLKRSKIKDELLNHYRMMFKDKLTKDVSNGN